MNKQPELLDCGHFPSPDDFTTGYATDSNNKTFCYDCCAEGDKKFMRENGKITLYLSGKWENNGYNPPSNFTLSNWPGSLKIIVVNIKKGKHNIAGCRYDIWFKFENTYWHGTSYGNNSEICYCKRIK